jgi:hypothetical protein
MSIRLPRSRLARAAHRALAGRMASLGERIQSYFDTPRLRAGQHERGFRYADDVGPEQLAMQFFPEPERPAPARGAHIMRARKL